MGYAPNGVMDSEVHLQAAALAVGFGQVVYYTPRQG